MRATLDWAKPRGRRVIAVTVDHGLNPESAAWTRRALGVADALGAEARSCAWVGDKPSSGLPARARQARHRLLAETARKAGAKVVLLGHTADDLIEAERMRRAGSSVGSPSEWSPSPVWPEGRGVFVLRPLLDWRRQALRDWLSGQGLDWIEDPANADVRFARARARAAGVGGAVPPPAATPSGLAELAVATDTPPWGGLELDRSVIRDADSAAAERWVQMAAACASGRERSVIAGRAQALAGRLRGWGEVVATLGGARIEAGAVVRVCRDAGERARGGLAPASLVGGDGLVWDGRFEISGAGTVTALAGLTRRLPPGEAERLKTVPASARASLPVIHGDGMLTCPLLAGRPGSSCRPLAGERLLAACGVIAREVE